MALIRSLSLERAQKGLYDFGMEVASRSGILALYRRENSPEATSALGNIDELLNSMKLFKEQRDAEIRDAEIRAGVELGEATVEEWLQSVTLTTDMDKKEDAGDDDKVTLMTVHSAKGLEFKYVYIVGMEETLFPSQRAAESPEGFEEERRLFYVALTRAKCSAVLSYAEMRYEYGETKHHVPSCFLREIDPRYLDGAVGAGQTPVREEAAAGGRTALEELRRRFDVRYQQRAGGSGNPSFGGEKSSFGGRGGAYSGGSRPESGAPSFGGRGGTDSAFRRPALQRPVVPENLRRLGGGAAPAAGNAAASGYAVGERVEHPKFGYGEIVRIETLAADHKLVVVFEEYGEKTLLAKFAKLTKR